MKALIVGKYLAQNRLSTEQFIIRAFHDLRWDVITHEINAPLPMLINNLALLVKAIKEKPDVIIIPKAFGIYPETIATIKKFIDTTAIGWWPDPVLEHDGKSWDRILARLYKPYDLYAQTTGWPEHLKTMESLGIKKAAFVPQGCDTTVHRPVPVTPEELKLYGSDVTFIGGFYEGDRGALLRRVWEHSQQGKNFSVKYWGGGFPAELPHAGSNSFGEILAKIYSASKICLHTNSINTVPLYFSDRYYLSMSCGIFTLVQYIPGLETLFTNHDHLVWFNDQNEACQLIDYYLQHDDERSRIAKTGLDKAWREDTYTARIKTLLELTSIQP